MKFEILNKVKLGDYWNDVQNLPEPELVESLKSFLGWVLLEDKSSNDEYRINMAFYVTEYTFVRNRLEVHFNKYANFKSLEDGILETHDTINNPDIMTLYNTDILHKLIEYEEIEKPSTIRWWKKGKFENLQTYENFINEMDPYGEEEWGDNDIYYIFINLISPKELDSLIVVKGDITENGDGYFFSGDSIKKYDRRLSEASFKMAKDEFIYNKEGMVRISNKEELLWHIEDALKLLSWEETCNEDALRMMAKNVKMYVDEKGYFDNFEVFWKKLENINIEDIDPYGEEDWNDLEPIDLTIYEGREKYEQLLKILVKLVDDEEMEDDEGVAINFTYTKMVVEDIDWNQDDELEDFDVTYDEQGQITVRIFEIKYKDDGLIFRGLLHKYINEEWYDIYTNYTIPQNQTIYLTEKNIEIKI
jgi:hypothetical protein